MHPTPEEQLQAVLRNLDEVAAETSLAPAPRAALEDAQRLLRRLERAWARRLPFLLLDNQLATKLLASLAPLLPDLADEIETTTTEHTAIARHDIDEPAGHDLNKRLQGLLGRAVHLLPDDTDGDAGRARIAEHLRSRLGADPALNREPSDRLPPLEPNP